MSETGTLVFVLAALAVAHFLLGVTDPLTLAVIGGGAACAGIPRRITPRPPR